MLFASVVMETNFPHRGSRGHQDVERCNEQLLVLFQKQLKSQLVVLHPNMKIQVSDQASSVKLLKRLPEIKYVFVSFHEIQLNVQG